MDLETQMVNQILPLNRDDFFRAFMSEPKTFIDVNGKQLQVKILKDGQSISFEDAVIKFSLGAEYLHGKLGREHQPKFEMALSYGLMRKVYIYVREHPFLETDFCSHVFESLNKFGAEYNFGKALQKGFITSCQ